MIERYIGTIIHLRTRAEKQHGLQDRILGYANRDLADLEMETKPEDVLAEIHHPQQREHNKRESL